MLNCKYLRYSSIFLFENLFYVLILLIEPDSLSLVLQIKSFGSYFIFKAPRRIIT